MQLKSSNYDLCLSMGGKSFAYAWRTDKTHIMLNKFTDYLTMQVQVKVLDIMVEHICFCLLLQNGKTT